MKPITFLAVALLLAGCGKQDAADREVLSQLASLKSELAAHQSQPIRWATADKRAIESAVNEWNRQQAEAAKSQENLTPEQLDQVRNYEALSAQLMNKRFGQRRFAGLMPPGGPGNAESDKDYEALAHKVEAAQAPIADILKRRAEIYSKISDQHKVEQLIAEYAKDRFDLVVDSSEAGFNRSAVLYSHAGESLDITQGVIKLFQDKIAK